MKKDDTHDCFEYFGGVTSIGNGAFASTPLKQISLPPITTIPQSCFSACNQLELVVFPASVETLGFFAFEGCDALANIFTYGEAFSWSGFEAPLFAEVAGARIHVLPLEATSFGGVESNYLGFEVTSLIADYTDYVQTFGLSGDYADPQLDPEGRGIPNGIAYLYDLPLSGLLPPTVFENLPRASNGNDGLCAEFVVPKILPTDMTLSIEVTDDLSSGTWEVVASKTLGSDWDDPYEVLTIEAINPEFNRVCLLFESPAINGTFMRLATGL